MRHMDEIVDRRVVADFREITEEPARHGAICLHLNSVADANAAGMRNDQLGAEDLPDFKSLCSDHDAGMDDNILSDDRSLKNDGARPDNCPISNLHIARGDV